jgi:hypothetical protein
MEKIFEFFEFLAGVVVLTVVFGGVAFALWQDFTLPEVHKTWPDEKVVKVFVIEDGEEKVVEDPQTWFQNYKGQYHTVWVGR